MGSSEDEGKHSKPEKSSPTAMDQHNVHVFPDWAAMQAYYGPRVAVPPYINSAVTSGHAPLPYMWGPPQAMMPHYGAPYAAFYAHGGMYPHPGVPLAGTSLSMDTQAKSSGNGDGSLVKKAKEFNGLAMSIGNGIGTTDTDSAEGGGDHRFSKSGDTEGSSDASDGITAGVGQKRKKRNREGTPNNAVCFNILKAGDSKAQTENNTFPPTEVCLGSGKMVDMVVPTDNMPEKVTGNITMALELKDSSNTNAKFVPQLPKTNEARLPNERDLKRERRKQSNRESARRSRLRKQAEAEELAMKVQKLTSENKTLKSEINKLMENSDMLKIENAKLMEKLKDAQLGQTEISLHTANLLARVNNEGDTYENRHSGAKLRQLLDASPRTDAVAAG